MNPQEFYSTILASVTTSALATAVLGWIFREWISTRLKSAIQHEYDQKLETHKAQLKSESDISVEKLKSQLHIAASERNIQYSTVFEMTAKVLSETAEKLQDFLEAAAGYTSIINNVQGPERDARRIATGKAYSEFLKYFRPKKMFIPKATVARIEEFHSQLHSQAIDFMFMVDQGNEKYINPDITTWKKVHDFMTKEVPKLQEMLEDDFRKILGLITHEA